MKTVVLDYPFRGRWRALNSPARRVPSHGTTMFGTKYAIDFVPVDERGRSAPMRLGSWFGTDDPAVFTGFGRPVLAPVTGVVVAAWDSEPDHRTHRGFASVGYLFSQRRRAREGWLALAGNHVVISMGKKGPFVAVVHLKQGSVTVTEGDQVEVGQEIGACGNSGNSTEPHVHLQVNDSTDWATAVGIPLSFRCPEGQSSLPEEGEIVEI